MTSWTDDFTHDYFADSTYVSVGAAATSVGGGQLVLDAAGGDMAWYDPRAGGLVGTLELHVLDVAAMAGVELGVFAAGTEIVMAIFGPAPGSPGSGVVEYLYTDGVDPPSNGTNLTPMPLPPSGPIVVQVAITPTDATLTVVGVGAFTQPIPSAIALAVAAAAPPPVAGLIPDITPGDAPLIITEWAYDFGTPPAAVGSIAAGQHSTGVKPHARRLR